MISCSLFLFGLPPSYATTPYGSDERPSYSYSYFIKRVPGVLIEGGGIRGLKKIDIAGSTQYYWGQNVLLGEFVPSSSYSSYSPSFLLLPLLVETFLSALVAGIMLTMSGGGGGGNCSGRTRGVSGHFPTRKP